MVILGTLYLIPEAIFNSQLVSLLGLGTPSKEDLEHLELFGRSISGIGVTLLFMDMLKAKFINTIPKAIMSFSLLFVIIWSIVFYGQKFLIETYIINPSSPEQRQQAVYSAFLRDALAADAIKIEGVNYDSKYIESPENLTFLALFGGLIYADKNMSSNLEEEKEKIIYKFVKQKAYEDFNENYKEYGKLYEELSESYKSYAKGSYKYNDTISNIPSREAEYWVEIENTINNGFSGYKSAQKAHIARASGRAQKYGGNIYNYFEKISKCRERYKKRKYAKKLNKCIENLDIKYRRDILKLGLGYIEPNHWLIAEKISTTSNVLNSVVMGTLTGGIYTAMQAANAVAGGDGGFKDVKYKYTSNPDHYQLRILQLKSYNDIFVKETGYPFGIQNLEQFRSHEVTNKKLITKFNSKGLVLNKKWNINKRSEFYSAVDKKVRLEADTTWRREVRKKGYTFSPNLTWNEFQLHPEIQQTIKKKIGDNYVKNIKSDWNKKNFKINVVDVNIERKTKEYLRAIKSALVHFEDGGKYEEYGKQALRSVLIPPISMFLSLFLICLTITKLPYKYYKLFSKKEINIENKYIRKTVFFINKIYMPVLILVLPVLIVTSIYTEDKKNTVNYFLNKVEENTSMVVSYTIRWTIHTQPLLHPLGKNLEELTSIYKSFDNVSHFFHNIDIDIDKKEKTIKKENMNLNTEDYFIKDLLNSKDDDKLNRYLSKINKGLLIVEAPKGSRIQIMNIKPKYKKGILLNKGRYDIKVTYPDGKIKRKKYNIYVKKNIININ